MESIENKKNIAKEETRVVSPVETVSSYQGWLVSDKFYKRVLAVVGHYAVGSVAIVICLAIISFLVMVLSSFFV